MSKQVKSLKKSEKDIFDTLTTKSGWIRYLDSLGWSRGDIQRYLNSTVLKGKKQIRYQHVRNVLTQEVKTPVDQF
jgi:hypothetical protein